MENSRRLREFPEIPVHFETNPEDFHPYRRNPTTLARPWAIPGTPGLEHRVGGIEKQDVTGNINYDPLNHERMVRLRAAKVEAVADEIPDAVPAGDTVRRSSDRRLGLHARPNHCRAQNRACKGPVRRPRSSAPPEPAAEKSRRRPETLQARSRPRNEHGPAPDDLCAPNIFVDAQGYNKIQGKPFKQSEIEQKIDEILE